MANTLQVNRTKKEALESSIITVSLLGWAGYGTEEHLELFQVIRAWKVRVLHIIGFVFWLGRSDQIVL